MKSFVFAAVLSGIASATKFPATKDELQLQDYGSLSSLFDRYVSHFHKEYSAAERKEHFSIFQDRVEQIFEWNSETKTFTKGINQFTDLDDAARREYVMPETLLKDVCTISIICTYYT